MEVNVFVRIIIIQDSLEVIVGEFVPILKLAIVLVLLLNGIIC